MTLDTATLARAVADDLKLPARAVETVLALFDDGATVPFVARYRKERTGGLDEVQLRAIEQRREQRVELERRRDTIIEAITEQGKLTPALRTALVAATTKQVLEDLYLPFKQKRRTRAAMARDRGLAPLAERILAQGRDGDPQRAAQAFVRPDADPARAVVDVDAALAGARDIVAEVIADRADVRAVVRETYTRDGVVRARLVKAKDTRDTKDSKTTKANEGGRFDGYADHAEPVRTIPAHRVLAVLRGEAEGALKVGIDVDTERLLPRLDGLCRLTKGTPWARELGLAIDDAFKRLIAPSIETEVRADLKARADADAIKVFAENLHGVLLAPPLGAATVIGIDPGFRTGCKCAVVDGSGRFLEAVTIFPSQGQRARDEAQNLLRRLVKTHQPVAIAVGNGTAGRETEAFVRETLTASSSTTSSTASTASTTNAIITPVNESGASIYSASDLAREEFPDLDLTVRGAISIARRLQDPLAELVKVDPQSIGVGQYQHDVNQTALQKTLDAVVEGCVSAVGVDLNTASAPLLARVAGIGPGLAKKIVAHRESHGVFRARAGLLSVRGLGARTFEQAAGFLRVRGGNDGGGGDPKGKRVAKTERRHPLDASGVHPERYALVEQMAADLDVDVGALVENASLAGRIELSRYVGGDVGLPTLQDIVAELGKPGRDPRKSFEAPSFRDDVREITDLQPGMKLSGVVTNVTAFGAFVDVGVHQDGLVHISQLADRFVDNPHDVVTPGDRIQVRVVEVDVPRKRISLSAKGL